MSTSHVRHVLPVLVCLTLPLAGCSEEKSEPTSQSSSETPSPPPPSYGFEKIKSALFIPKDLGSKWTEEATLDAFKEGRLRGCSDSRIKLPKNPRIVTKKFGDPKFRTTGANYAYFIAVYPDAADAADAMNMIREHLSDCPENDKIPFKRLPDKKFIYQHDNTWKSTDGEISGWKHIRGLEKSVYPPSISIINVIYFSIDYAQRGNVVFSSIYWQRKKPKDSGDQVAEKATELLEDQLKRFG